MLTIFLIIIFHLHISKVQYSLLNFVSADFVEVVDYMRMKSKSDNPLYIVQNNFAKDISRRTNLKIRNETLYISNVSVFRNGEKKGYTFLKKIVNVSMLCLEMNYKSLRELLTNIVRIAIINGNDAIIISESWIRFNEWDHHQFLKIISDLDSELTKGIKRVCITDSQIGGGRFFNYLDYYKLEKKRENQRKNNK
jgi:hypothetical protein